MGELHNSRSMNVTKNLQKFENPKSDKNGNSTAASSKGDTSEDKTLPNSLFQQ